MEYVLGMIGITAFELMLTLIGFAILGFIVLRKSKANSKASNEEFGEDVPPVIVAGDTVRPQPLPSSFGRSPDRE